MQPVVSGLSRLLLVVAALGTVSCNRKGCARDIEVPVSASSALSGQSFECSGGVDEMAERGKSLHLNGEFEAALEVFKECPEVLRYELFVLAADYPNARAFLERRRSLPRAVNAASRIDDGVLAYVSWNSMLGYSAENALFFRRWRDAKAPELVEVHRLLWPDLVKEGRFADALAFESNIRESLERLRRVAVPGSPCEQRRRRAEIAAPYVEALLGEKRVGDVKAVLQGETEARGLPFGELFIRVLEKMNAKELLIEYRPLAIATAESCENDPLESNAPLMENSTAADDSLSEKPDGDGDHSESPDQKD